IQDFKDRINNLVQAGIVKSEPDHDLERQKLIEGLAKILYNSVYILIDPKSIGDCLTNILSGIYKVVSAILADGKVDYTDWAKVLRALASIFKLPYHHNKNYHNQNYSDTAI
ncbi:MAG: hypothetical protein EBX41_10430, partial [Chitinophagia bacterium]|nr:hypothetical protein [Chitinophagia bacterium]